MTGFGWVRPLIRVALITGAALAISLGLGTLLSFVPNAPLEGYYGGKIITGAVLVLAYLLVIYLRGSTRKRAWVFDLHSLLGLGTGILLSVIFLSGVLLLYRPEIDLALNPWMEIEPGSTHLAASAWIDAVEERTDLSTSDRIDIAWPVNERLPVRISVNGPGGFEQYYVDPYSAQIVDGSLRKEMNWIRRLHTSFNLGKAGHWIAGLVSLAAIWLCIGGLTMGRDVVRKWYLLRWRNGLPIFFSDLHKRIGLWLLPFIALNAFAGLLATFSSQFSVGPVQARFGGNYGELYEAAGSPQGIERVRAAAMPPIDEFLSIARQIMPDAAPSQMRIVGYGDQNTIANLRLSRDGDLAPDGGSLLLNIRATTGEITLHKELAKAGIFERATSAISAFHFAQYGGNWIRLLHAVTAVIISALPFIGMALWFLRRRRYKSTSRSDS